MARKLAAGNWKMNGVEADLAEVDALGEAVAAANCDVLLCPPATLIAPMAKRAGLMDLYVGGQTCHTAASGAHTGDVSAAMLADAGASHVILGHSERRADHGERSEDVAAQVTAAIDANLIAIICVGETEAERDANVTLNVVSSQLAGSIPTGATPAQIVVAYEPVWAIGTGRTPTLEQIAEVHDHIRSELAARRGSAANDIPLLYGGSVKPGNAAEIFAVSNVDGALVGGASLKASDFGGIIAALSAA
ncbi:triose-phosphate isomerase [Jannaschia sp. CCS1]|uniref:Triosephosphate isomerase n=1 Tax=Jannaschia sp. (strain CCS1) TaxID=290400 RepID=TPIS_JANSC|nr:triose-phosphate isomerase [Jannaschia sp. CCS1]Q28RL2.1 RecName: Full=Triosephosphate isomerase; Short=TIM; Short=TPI; AltName: Full=Triose-phosphate isomerase [Jannaschia sp. CCS1]ABD54650.1 triosephosphate isomerase [Jannaschia sp. CCS1]